MTASLTDPDGAVSGVSWVWAVGASSSGSFTAVSGATAASFTVRAADHGKYLQATVTYTDTVHSAAGQTASEATAEIKAANAAPAFLDTNSDGTADPVSLSVAENTTSGDVGSAVTATDPDAGDVLAYSVAAVSNSPADTADLVAFNEDFAVDAATGRVTVKAGAVIDFESRASYVVSYRVSDKKDAAGDADTVIDDTLVLTVAVSNVNEAGSVSISGTVEAGQALTASLTDPDGSVSSLSWQWSKAVSSSATFTDITSATSASYTVDVDDIAMVLKATVTYTDTVHSAAGQTAESEATAEVGAANAAPVFAGTAVSRMVEENTMSGDVGSAVTATDPDAGDVLAYSVAAVSNSPADTADLVAFNEDFAVDAATGRVTVKAGAVIDFESRASYVVSYRVSDKKDAAGDVDTVIDDTLVLTVAVSNVNEAGSVSISGTVEAGEALTASLTDPDGAVSGVSWVWAVGASSSGSFTAVSGATAASFTVRAADHGKYLQATVTYTDTVHSAAGQTASEATAEIKAANAAPAFLDTNSDGTADPVSLSVAENTTSGDVGSAVTATDPDAGDVLAYSVAAVSNSPADTADLVAFNEDFAVDAATGRVTVKAGAVIDFESRASYVVSYRVSDKKDAAGDADTVIDDTLVLTVAVSNVNEAGSVSISGTVEAGQALTASLTDPDGSVSSLSWQWSKAVSSSATFTDITSATSASYTVDVDDIAMVLKATVTYTDTVHSAAGQTAASEATAEVGAANAAPVFAGTAVSRMVEENTMSGDVGSAVTATDPDAGDVLAYSVAAVSNSPADTADLVAFNEDFAVDAATGRVTVKAGAVIDFESRASYVVSYRVSDKKDAAGAVDTVIDDTLVLTVAVSNVNEAGSVSISGDPEAGTELTASLTDPDGSVSSLSWQWSKAVSSSATFTNITSATSASYTVDVDDIAMVLKATVTYTDTVHSATNQTAESEATAEVGAANAAPAFLDTNSDGTADPVSLSVAENTTSGDVGSPVTATDPDAGDVLAYSVAAVSNSPADTADLVAFNEDFAVDAATGRVTVKAGAVIDFESRASYVVSYRVSDNKDAAGAADTVIDDTLVLTVTVSNVNEAGSVSITGTVEAGQQLTAVLADPDGTVSGVSWVWAVGASSSGPFTPIPSGGAAASFTVRAADHGKYLQATVGYTDTVHSAPSQTASKVTAKVSAANEAPVFAADTASRVVAENTMSGDVGAVVTATDLDAGDVLAYSISVGAGADAAADLVAFNEDFVVDAATGQITVKAGAVIDYESRAAYVVSYRVSDNKDAAGAADTVIDDTLVLTVTVSNVNEAGSVSITGTVEAGQQLTAVLADPDGTVSGVSWVWAVGASSSGPFTPIPSGGAAASFTVRAADHGKYLQATVGYTDTVHSAPSQTASKVTAKVSAANEAPVFAADTASRVVAENTMSGDVGAVVTATDLDAGDVLAYSISVGAGADAAADLVAFNEDFVVDAATGRVTVKAGAVIDYESRAAYVVSYRVSDEQRRGRRRRHGDRRHAGFDGHGQQRQRGRQPVVHGHCRGRAAAHRGVG